MMTLQGMADHRFTSVSLSTNVFLGEIIKKNWKLAYLRPSLPFYDMKNIQHLWRGLAAGCHSKNKYTLSKNPIKSLLLS